MKRIGVILGSTLLAAGGIVALGTPAASAAACGATVKYGTWQRTDSGSIRTNTWTYLNCDFYKYARKTLNLRLMTDPACMSIAPGATRKYTWYETSVAGKYQGTYDC